MKSLRHEGVPTEIDCDQCGAQMIIKWGKRGEFLSCSRYPDCKNAKQFEYGSDSEIRIKERKEPELRYDILCDLCGKPMAVRKSRFGKFLGCSGYPECKNTKRLQKEAGEGEEGKEEKQKPRRKFFKKSGRKEAKA